MSAALNEADATIANVTVLLNTIVNELLEADRNKIAEAVASIDRATALTIIARDTLERVSDDLRKAGGTG